MLNGKQRKHFGDMGVLELIKSNNLTLKKLIYNFISLFYIAPNPQFSVALHNILLLKLHSDIISPF